MKRNNNIFEKLFQIIYVAESVEMSFNYSKDTAIERLRSDLNKNEYQAMVGRANSDEVIIQRGRAFFQPIFNPIFTGSFEEGYQTTKLSGVFRAHIFSQVFATLLAVFVVLSFFDGFAELITNPSNYNLFPFKFGTFILIILIALSMLSLLITWNDKEWLRKNISDAINKGM